MWNYTPKIFNQKENTFQVPELALFLDDQNTKNKQTSKKVQATEFYVPNELLSSHGIQRALLSTTFILSQ